MLCYRSPLGAERPNTGSAMASMVSFNAETVIDKTHVALVTKIPFLTQAQEAALVKNDKLCLIL